MKEKIKEIVSGIIVECLKTNDRIEGADNSVYIFGYRKGDFLQFFQCSVVKQGKDGKEYVHNIPSATSDELLSKNCNIKEFLNKNLNVFERNALNLAGIDLQDVFNRAIMDFAKKFAKENNIKDDDVCFVVTRKGERINMFPFIQSKKQYGNEIEIDKLFESVRGGL